MLIRFLVVLALVAVVTVVALVVRATARRRAAAAIGHDLPGTLAGRLPERQAAILYFFGPHCGTCRQQSAIVERLEQAHDCTVLRIDAAQESSLAQAFGVMTVPATVIVDRTRRVRAVNLGFRGAKILDTQLQEALGLARAG